MRFYAHTKSNADGTPRPQDEWLFNSKCPRTMAGTPRPQNEWEPLFSEECQLKLKKAKAEK